MKATKNNIQILLLLAILNGFNSILAQELINFSGSVVFDDKPVEDVLVTMTDGTVINRMITNELGQFEMKNYNSISDSLSIKINRIGFKEFTGIYATETLNLLINLESSSPEQLDEIIVKSSGKFKIDNNKKTYRINPKDFTNTAKAETVLKTIPEISIIDGQYKLNNRKNVKFFVDGLESDIQEVGRINIKNIEKIEVISNPSASYGGEFSGAILQIFMNDKEEDKIKGELEIFKGIRLGIYGVVPSVSLKTEKLTLKTFYSYSKNNQNIDQFFRRETQDSIFEQNSYRKLRGWQSYLGSRGQFRFNESSSLTISGSLVDYEFDGSTNGTFMNENNQTDYILYDKEYLKKWDVSSIYKYKIDKKKEVSLKLKYFNYLVKNSSVYNGLNKNNVISGIKEWASEFDYTNVENDFLGIQIDLDIGLRGIFRQFNFPLSEFNLKQDLFSAFINSNWKISNSYSFSLNLVDDITMNKSEDFNNSYNNFLPSLSFLYTFSETNNFKLSYSRRIRRPGAENLNPRIIFFDLTRLFKGNQNLNPEIKDSYELFFTSGKNGIFINSGVFFENTKNAITESYENKDDVIFRTFQNGGNAKVTGFSFGFNSKIFKKIDLNFNSGLSYNLYKSDTPNTIIQKNEGLSINSSIYLYYLIKDNFSVSASGFFVSPTYSLLTTRDNNPNITLSTEKTFFKDNLTARLEYSDVFGFASKSEAKISNNTFQENINTENKMTNLTFTLIYDFGKSFNDRFENNVIDNNDILKK